VKNTIAEGDKPSTSVAWWRDPRWIIGCLVVVTVGTLLWGLFGPEPPIIVSRETTYITEPLRPDGMPDYRAYVLDRMYPRVPPEENAAVAVLHATWPMQFKPTQLAALCKALGISDTPPESPPLISANDDQELLDELNKLIDQGPSKGGTAALPHSPAASVIGRAERIPWRREECPPLAAWVARQAPAIDRLVEAAGRPRYQLPPPALLVARQDDWLIILGLSSSWTYRAMWSALLERAMLSLGEGRMSSAWRDIHAVHRLGRLVAPAGSRRSHLELFNALFASERATAATLVLLDSPQLSVEQAASIRFDFDALPPHIDATSCLEWGRLEALDTIVAVAGMTRSERAATMASGGAPTWCARTSIDMNIVLQEANALHDAIATAASLPGLSGRRLAIEEIERGFAARRAPPTGWENVALILRLVTNRADRSIHFSERVLGITTSSLCSVVDAATRATARASLLRVAVALVEYRVRGVGGDGHPYPVTLDELVPDLLAAVPIDPFSKKPFVYERRGDGYLLYSIGENGIDEGGTDDQISQGEWRLPGADARNMARKDIVIRMPRPKRSILGLKADSAE
jgi:hypothetical protein